MRLNVWSAAINPAAIIRPAADADAPALSVLALRSKAFWGYDHAFMRACIPEMAITPADLARCPTFVLAEGAALLGFATLAHHSGARITLDALFVAPEAIGSGAGRRLFEHAAAQARALGARTMHIEADPNAEAFYLHMGARRIGATPSGSIPGRMLPLLEYDLVAAQSFYEISSTDFADDADLESI